MKTIEDRLNKIKENLSQITAYLITHYVQWKDVIAVGLNLPRHKKY